MPSPTTPFIDRVRAVVRAIPCGETRTYQEVARSAGSPNTARAVGNIMARNYLPDVPCHRVVRANGDLGGYNRGGRCAKAKLLELEKRRT